MTKQNPNTWKCTYKITKVTSGYKVVELQEDSSLFARMMVVCTSRPDINLQEAIGTYKLSIVPRSMYAADGTILRCAMKINHMHILEQLHADVAPTTITDTDGDIAEVDNDWSWPW
jgi:hypothetical protein